MSVGSVISWRGQQSRSLRNNRKTATPSQPPEELSPRSRLAILQSLLVFAAFGIALRLYCLQGEECHKWTKIASRQHDSSIQVQGARGTVLDAGGRTLAVSVRAFALGAHPQDVKNKNDAAKALAKLTGEPKDELENKLSGSGNFVWLARGLSGETANGLRGLEIPGLAIVPEFRRSYPQNSVAGAILGRVDRDGKGLAGVELAFNQMLSAASMHLAVRRDARGRLLPASVQPDEPGYETLLNNLPQLLRDSEHDADEAPERALRNEGDSLTLSVDAMVQEILEQELKRGQDEAKAKRAFGLLMDAETGEILAMAQTPGFNPNRMDDVSPDQLHNSVLQDNFEPGSTLKPLIAGLALDQKVVHKSDSLDCENGVYNFHNHVIRDVHPSGMLSFPDILVRSSNICMAKIGQRLGKDRLYDGLRSLGLGETTRVELPGEGKGILRNADNWAEIDTLTHAFGQGVSVTALQLVQAYSALANGGLLVQPTLLKRSNENPARYERVFTTETAHTISDILAGVTEDEHGTGHKAAVKGVTVRGKTGTAQKARLDGRGYDPEKILASFIGFIDGRDIGLQKKLVMFIAIDEPSVKIRFGGVVAAPVFSAAMERILSQLVTRQGSDSIQTALETTREFRKS